MALLFNTYEHLNPWKKPSNIPTLALFIKSFWNGKKELNASYKIFKQSLNGALHVCSFMNNYQADFLPSKKRKANSDLDHSTIFL